ncbi:hypothetical protein L1049_026163 [Liquidambar formosana]|uniref:Uncharacterized protein n=1 Tax=Liquidambar formosana TaxID=63359 RepID=A0AAP0R588_LIQFO
MKGIFWLLVGSVFEVRGVLGLYSCVSDYFPMFDPYEHLTLVLLIYCSLLTFQFWVLCMAYAFGRGTLSQPIGRTVRSGVDVITLCAAIILRHCLPHNYYCIETLVSYTVLLHCLGPPPPCFIRHGFLGCVIGSPNAGFGL